VNGRAGRRIIGYFVDEGTMHPKLLRMAVGCLLLAAVAGCQQEVSPTASSKEMPTVPVSLPVEREVTDFVDFTGRTAAIQSVDVRPRVTGYLVKICFVDGAEVKEGDLLFEIDPRPYQAQLDQAVSQVKLNEASLRIARANYDRDRASARVTPDSVSRQQLDEDRATVDEALARVNATKSSTKIYELNLGFTQVHSPIDGQASRTYLTLGNLVNQDQTLLTTIVALHPMFVYFDMDEPTLLRVRKAINEGTIPRYQDGTMTVLMGLQGEQGYPHRGTVNFINNQVNPTTGSISVRGRFPNPKPMGGAPGPMYLREQAAATLGLLTPTLGTAGFPQAAGACGVAALGGSVVGGERMLSPGMFVRVRLPISEPHQAKLVIDRAISSDQGLKYVYVLGPDNKLDYRRVTTGPLQEDGLRVITKGLEANDRVVVGGLQQVRPNMQVRPEPITMPTLAPPPGESAPVSPARRGGEPKKASGEGKRS
jgi:multidrug efflux system membrane fusion protein